MPDVNLSDRRHLTQMSCERQTCQGVVSVLHVPRSAILQALRCKTRRHYAIDSQSNFAFASRHSARADALGTVLTRLAPAGCCSMSPSTSGRTASWHKRACCCCLRRSMRTSLRSRIDVSEWGWAAARLLPVWTLWPDVCDCHGRMTNYDGWSNDDIAAAHRSGLLCAERGVQTLCTVWVTGSTGSCGSCRS